MNIGSKINYQQLLIQNECIRIPLIQRDYAQGRASEREVREEFLSALEDALKKPTNDPALPLNLDFIYGSVEGDQDTQFLPLDGQQRLTTLFLLHWYLAWCDDEWQRFEQIFQNNGHSRFAYSVRPSSTEFFDELVKYRPTVHPEYIEIVSRLIIDQSWYFLNWRFDQTIQSAINMIDAIHIRFRTTNGLFSRLIDEDQPAITFYLLPMDNFGLSDDLYIKMNARGKPLTVFETFKARYEQELKHQLTAVPFEINGQPLSTAEYVARQMDTTWAELFWNLRDRESNLYDNAFMNLIRMVALITRDPNDTEYAKDSFTLRYEQNISYSTYHTRGWLDERFTITIIRLLDSWSSARGSLAIRLPDTRFLNEKEVFIKVVSSGTDIPFTEIVQFAAYTAYIVKHYDSIDSGEFQEFMRIIYNLTVNTDYRLDDIRGSIYQIDELVNSSPGILLYIAQNGEFITGFAGWQAREEKIKAQLILSDRSWRELIDRAEQHEYFRGQIGFLLDFCGVDAAVKEKEPEIWDDSKHTELQNNYLRYLRLAEAMFTSKGLEDPGEYIWQRALLSIGDYLLPSNTNDSFLVNSATEATSWKRMLRGYGFDTLRARRILHQLWERLSPNQDITVQLKSIIESIKEIEPWREALMHCPEAIEYCERTFMRRHESGAKYLLKRSQLNGYHAELFTYCLHHGIIKDQKLNRLYSQYEYVTDMNTEPHIKLNCRLNNIFTSFDLYHDSIKYIITIYENDCKRISNLMDLLVSLGFKENNYYMLIEVSHSEINKTLIRLDESLDSKFNNEANNV